MAVVSGSSSRMILPISNPTLLTATSNAHCRRCTRAGAQTVDAAPACDNSSKSSSTPLTPLLDAVVARAAQTKDAPFHVPGHKKGQNISPGFQQLLDRGVLKHDLTEITGLDYLASPSGVIQQAQQLAAATFSADRTWFLVNGSSVGIHAAIMSLVGPGDALMVARNCHQSAFAGMTLSGCTPWWLQPEVDTHLGIAHCITPGALEAALEAAAAKDTRVGAVLIVSPTYFGTCADIAGLAKVCHAANVPLIVDEAHGAHFGLHPQLPASAMQQGADVAIQSTHKVLSAMTQAAMLHVQGPRVDHARVSRALQMLQSSSPSYVLMASIDAARAHAEQPELCFGKALQAAKTAVDGLGSTPGVSLLQYTPSSVTQPRAHAAVDDTELPAGSTAAGRGLHLWQDPLRLTVCVAALGITGYEASAILEEQYHVVPELATQQVVVLALGPGSTLAHAQQLVHAFQDLSAQLSSSRKLKVQHASSSSAVGPAAVNVNVAHSTMADGYMGCVDGVQSLTQAAGGLSMLSEAQGTMRLTPRDAFFAPSERVSCSAAVGRVSSELLCPYPPGVPVVYPGELITAEAMDVLHNTLAAGGKVTGASDDSLKTIMVVHS